MRAAGEVDDPLGRRVVQRLRGWMEYPTVPSEIWLCRDETTAAVAGW